MGAVCLLLEKRDEKTCWKLLLRKEVSIQEIKMLLSSFIGKLPAESSGEGSLGMLGTQCSAEQKAGPFCWGDSGLLQTRDLAVPRCCLSLPGMFYLNLMKHHLQEQVWSLWSGQRLREAPGCAVAMIQVGLQIVGLGFCSCFEQGCWFSACFLAQPHGLNELLGHEKNAKWLHLEGWELCLAEPWSCVGSSSIHVLGC